MNSTATLLKRITLALSLLLVAAPAWGQSATTLTAGNNYDQVKRAAQDEDADARLIAAAASDVTLSPNAGESETWFYLFSGAETSFDDPIVVAKDGGRISTVEIDFDFLGQFDQYIEDFQPETIPEDWIDSDKAVQRADAVGGADFRTNTDGVSVTALLVGLPESYNAGHVGGAAWLLSYRATNSSRIRVYAVDADNGNAIELKSSTARENLAAANNAASDFAGDADLVYAGTVVPDLNEQGQSAVWRYVYHSVDRGAYRAVYVVNGYVVSSRDAIQLPPSGQELPDNWIDSDEAIAAANASENFLQNDSLLNTLVQARLSRNVFPGMSNRAFWEFKYISLETGRITTVYVDATNGDVVEPPRVVETFEANLAGYNEVQPVETGASGSATVKLMDNGAITVSGEIDGLSSELMSVGGSPGHIHVGGPAENGPIVIPLDIDPGVGNEDGDIVSRTYDFDLMDFPDGVDADSVRSALENGNAYVNVHTEMHPGGEIRGQLLMTPNEAPEPVAITSPADGASVTIEGEPAQTLTAEWQSSTDPDGDKVVYVYQHSLSADFDTASVILNRNVGTATEFTLDYGTVDSVLAAAGVDMGETVTVYHRANAQDGSLRAEGAVSTLQITRGVLEPTTIASARDLAERSITDTTITIEGVLNSPDYGFGVGNFFVQDETAGILVFSPDRGGNADGPSPFSAGDLVRVTGSPDSFHSQLEFQADRVKILEDGDRDDVPEPVELAASDVTADSDAQGERVTVKGVQLTDESDWPTDPILSGSGVNVEFFDPATHDTFTVRIDRGESFYDGSERPEGLLDVKGTLARFEDTAQIFPWFEGDIMMSTEVGNLAAVSFADQTSGGIEITVDSVFVPQGGFVAIHDSTLRGHVVTAINAGGVAYETRAGVSYQADTNFEGGTQGRGTDSPISGTNDDPIYQTERYASNFSYNIPVPENATYRVRLQFEEHYFNKAGQRPIDVTAEGTEIVSGLDIYGEVGGEAAYDVVKTVDVTDGTLNLDFTGDASSAKVAGIMVRSTGDALGSVIGVSGPLEAGVHTDLDVYLFDPPGKVPGLDTSAVRLLHDQTLIAMPHRDTNDNDVYDFLASEGSEDGPYLNGDGGAVTDPAEINVETALVSIDDQMLPADGSGLSTVTVNTLYLPDEGYVAIHDASLLGEDGEAFTDDDQAVPSVIGVSEYMEAGSYKNVEVTLFDVPGKDFPSDTALTRPQTIIAMPHMETNENQEYNFVEAGGMADIPFFDENNHPVVDLGDVTKGTAIDAPADVPAEFAILSTYPNPAREATHIMYDLPEPAEVTVKVFDVMGRRVMNRRLGQQQAGAKKKLTLDATQLPAGVYVYRLTATGGETHVGSGKLTLVR